jgi:hypothetical protein
MEPCPGSIPATPCIDGIGPGGKNGHTHLSRTWFWTSNILEGKHVRIPKGLKNDGTHEARFLSSPEMDECEASSAHDDFLSSLSCHLPGSSFGCARCFLLFAQL